MWIGNPWQEQPRMNPWQAKDHGDLSFVAEVFLKVESGVKHLAHRYDRADIKGALQKQCNPSKGENLAAHEAPAYRS
jgi:hypothetical protein